jgi:hypothetical protein
MEGVDLFRSIGRRELSDLLLFGDYGLSPSGSGKYFALTLVGVRRFAAARINTGRSLTVTRISVGAWVLMFGYRFPDPGGAGPSIHFPDEVLPLLYQIAGRPEIIDAPWLYHIDAGAPS